MPSSSPQRSSPQWPKLTRPQFLSRSFKRASSFASSSFKKASTKLFTSSVDSHPGHPSGVSFTAKDLARQASFIEANKSAWAGTQHLSDVEFEQRYLMREKLGEGSFGAVHRVLRNSDGAEFAAKTIEQRGSSSEWEEAQKEAVVWAALSSPYHPSILPLIETITVGSGHNNNTSTLYLITELMPCAVLGDAIFNVIMSEQAARLIIVQLTSAIAHLHLVHGIAHRDVKPDNVLCAQRDPTILGCLKLADFGLCQRFESVTDHAAFTEASGTIDYAAPELAAGFVTPVDGVLPPCSYGASVDVWALGCVAYELLHGQPPYYFPGNDEAESISRILAHDLTFPDESFGHISASCRDFLNACLAPDPTERLSIEYALAHEWLQPVQQESLRIAMSTPCPPSIATSIAQRRAQRTNQVLRGAGHKVVAMNRLRSAGAAKAAQRAGSSKQVDFAAGTAEAGTPTRAASPTSTPEQASHGGGRGSPTNIPTAASSPSRIVHDSNGSFRARSLAGGKTPTLVRAPSTVKSPQVEQASKERGAKLSVLARALSSSSVHTVADARDKGGGSKGKGGGKAKPGPTSVEPAEATEVDPMIHYTSVYKVKANELFASPERKKLAQEAKSKGMTLSQAGAAAAAAAKDKQRDSRSSLQSALEA